MSSIAEFQQELVATYLSTSACVWFLQETVFALRQEVDAIWNRKWTVMTWIYAFTRYSTAVDSILHLVPYGSSVQGCKANQYADDALSLIPFLCFALFSALRVHALLDGEYFIAGLVFVFNVVPFVTNMYNFTTSILVDNSEICTTFPSGSDNLRLALSLTTRVVVIIGDVLVLLVTWMKTAQSYREAKRLNINAPLATMLFRDGTIYFIILVTINVLQVAQINVPTLLTLDFAEPFFNVLPPIIICRFILNLRQVQPGGASCSSGSNKSISLRFVGNVGQSLQFGSDDTDLIEIDGRSTRADDCGVRAIGNGDVENDEAGRNGFVLADAAD